MRRSLLQRQWVPPGACDVVSVDGAVRAIVRVSDSAGQAGADPVRIGPAP